VKADWLKGISNRLDPFNPDTRKKTITVTSMKKKQEPMPRFGMPLQFTEEMNFLDQLRIITSRIWRTMTHPGIEWWRDPRLRRQIDIALDNVITVLLASTKNEGNIDLHEEIQQLFIEAKEETDIISSVQLKLYISYWVIGQKEGLWRDQMPIEDSDLVDEDITESYDTMREGAIREAGEYR
jgi:hypothetical protein